MVVRAQGGEVLGSAPEGSVASDQKNRVCPPAFFSGRFFAIQSTIESINTTFYPTA
jgi:hypothetical protein